MRKYYTRACNFFYGSKSKILIRKKLSLPLCGEKSISFNQIEILTRNKKKISSKIINIKDIKKLQFVVKKKVLEDIKKIIAKRKFYNKKSHILMGVLNMTPDSFSDGGKFNSFKNYLINHFLVFKKRSIFDLDFEELCFFLLSLICILYSLVFALYFNILIFSITASSLL